MDLCRLVLLLFQTLAPDSACLVRKPSLNEADGVGCNRHRRLPLDIIGFQRDRA